MFHRSLGRQCTHIAVLGNALPRRCGLATYTTHSVAALKAEFPGMTIDHYAMDDGHGDIYAPTCWRRSATTTSWNMSALPR